MSLDHLAVLTAGALTTKKWNSDGTLTPAADVKNLDVEYVPVGSLAELSAALVGLESQTKRGVIREFFKPDALALCEAMGDPQYQPGKLMRRQAVLDVVPHHWVMFDVDGFQVEGFDPNAEPARAVREFIEAALPSVFSGVSHHWKLSSSAGHPSVAPGVLKAHVWFWLDTPLTSPQLSAWAERNAPSVDLSVLRAAQWHFTARPVFDPGVQDPIACRSGRVLGERDAVALRLSPDELAAVPRIAKPRPVLAEGDDVVLALVERAMVLGQRQDGGLNVVCPRHEHHTSESADSSTIYYPAHTGGYVSGNFKCLHAHCAAATRDDFRVALGLPDSRTDPAKVGFGAAARAVEWTTAPVPRFRAPAAALDVLEDLTVRNSHDFSGRWERGEPAELMGDLAWRTGSNCATVLECLLMLPGVSDTPDLRAAIAERCASQLTHYCVAPMTEAQSGLASEGVEVTVSVDEGDWVRAEAQCLRALPHMGNLFKRDGSLVWVNARGGVTAYDIHRLSSRLEEHLDFVKRGGKPSRLPEAVGQRVIRNQDFAGVGELTAAIPLPSVRADGTVISSPGLDPSTGLYLLAGLQRPVGSPDLKATLARIWAPFAEFPFASDASRGALLAALLTSVCRVGLQSAPAFFINAQAPGTGKTKLSECIVLMATGSIAALDLPNDSAEQAKTLISALLEAPRGLLFDNLTGTLKASSTFCSAMTSPAYRARGLGGMTMVTVSNRALWVLNGNNVTLTGDAVRRIVSIRLDSPERPETEQHDFDPVAMVRDSLPEYRADLIDVLDAYRAAGMPRAPGGLASFEEWNALVRGCVVWAIGGGLVPVGMADPVLSIFEAAEDDPEAAKREMITAAWFSRFGDQPMRLRDVSAVCDNIPWMEAYEAICRRDNRIDPDRFAYWLRTNKGRITGGYRFVNLKDRDKISIWKLDKV